MAAAICVWTALILGLLYMSFSAWSIVYGAEGYGFNTEGKGLSFIGIGIGVFGGTCAYPLWGYYYAKVARETGARPPPEEHLRKGMAGAVLCPVALFWMAFTTYPNIHWMVSEVASMFFGIGCIWSFQASFAFLVSSRLFPSSNSLADALSPHLHRRSTRIGRCQLRRWRPTRRFAPPSLLPSLCSLVGHAAFPSSQPHLPSSVPP